MNEFSQDIFEPELAFDLEESDGKVGGTSVLAKVKGVFFVPDGTSRNKRYYPKSLWEKALGKKEIKEKITNKRMFGTIGHDQVINDQAILDGKISHIVTGLNIVDGKGIGEALILDTPAGRGLNTILQAGSKLFVSSRALGRFKGEKNGLPVVDENTYQLQTFDFVIDPGFLEAHPSLKESLEKSLAEEEEVIFDDNNNKDNNTNNLLGEIKMNDKELANHIMEENTATKKNLNEALESNDELKGELAIANNELTNVKEELEELNSVKEELDAFKVLGSVDDIKEALEAKKVVEAELKEYKEIDTDIESASEIVEAIDKAQARLDEYAKIGKPSAIAEALTKLTEFKESILEYGSVEEVEQLFAFAETAINKEKEIEKSEAIKVLAKELGISEEKVASVYGKLSEEEIKETFSGLKPSTKAASLKETFSSDDVDLDEVDEDEDSEEYDFESEKPLVERLMNIGNRKTDKK